MTTRRVTHVRISFISQVVDGAGVPEMQEFVFDEKPGQELHISSEMEVFQNEETGAEVGRKFLLQVAHIKDTELMGFSETPEAATDGITFTEEESLSEMNDE